MNASSSQLGYPQDLTTPYLKHVRDGGAHKCWMGGCPTMGYPQNRIINRESVSCRVLPSTNPNYQQLNRWRCYQKQPGQQQNSLFLNVNQQRSYCASSPHGTVLHLLRMNDAILGSCYVQRRLTDNQLENEREKTHNL